MATAPVLTASGGAIIPQGGVAGTPVPGYVQVGQPSTPTPSAGTLIHTSTAPASPPPTPIQPPSSAPTNNSSINNYGLTSASPNWYQLQNGESVSNYNSRIAAANPNLPAPGTTSSTGITNNADSPQVSADSQTPMLPTAPTLPTTSNADTTRSGLIQSQANTAATNPLSDPNNPLVANLKSAQDAYAKLKSDIAAKFAAIETGDQALPVALGQEGAMQKAYAAQLDAAATAVNTAQTALGQAVSAYSAQTGAQNAVTSQTQPSSQFTQVSPANQLYDANGQPVGASGSGGSLISPLTGQPFTSTGNSQGDSAVSGALQMIANGAGYSNAVSAMNLGLYGTKAISSLQSGLPAGFNPTADDAKAAANAKNLGTQTTTPTDTAAQGYQASQQAYISASTAYTSAQLQAANVQNILAQSGINSTNSTDWNNTINNLSSRLGSQNQTAYITGLNEMKQAYTNLLSSVGASTPTVNGQQATDIFNAGQTPKQIQAAIDALNNAAYAKLAPLYQQYQTYQTALGEGSANSNSQFNW